MLSKSKKKEEIKKGVTIEFISRDKLKESDFDEKMDLVLQKVKDDKILVMEEALAPEEKKELITRSVEEINEKFPGIEFSGLEDSAKLTDKFLNTLSRVLLGQERRTGITIVGNSDVMEKISEDRDSVSLMAKLNN